MANEAIERKQPEATRSSRSRRAADWPSRQEIASRINSLDWGGMIAHLPNPDPVLLNLGRDMKIYQDIIFDAQLTAVKSSRKSGVKSMLWDVDRGKSKSRQAKTVLLTLKRLDVPRIMNDILDYFLYGLAPLEVMWDKPSKNNGLILPYEMMGKPPEWFIYDSSNVLKFRSKTHSFEGEDLPPRKFIIPRHNQSYKNPYGESLLSTCYWPVIFKLGGWKFWVKFTEKFGSPYAIGKAPRASGEKEFTELANLCEQLVQDAVAAIPDDSSIEFLEASGKKASADVYRDLLNYCDSQISKAILGHGAAADSTPGKLGGENTQLNVRADLIDEDKRTVESCFNELIKWIMEINFGLGVDMPTFSLFKEQDIEMDRAKRDKTLSETGQVEFTQQYIDGAYGFQKGDVIVKPKAEPAPPPDPGAEDPDKKEKEEKEKKKAFAEEISSFKDQTAVDNMLKSIPAAELRKQAEFMRPIFDIFDREQDYSGAMAELTEMFTDLDTDEIEKMLKRAIFVTEVWGRLNENK
jgi:phage gp29-like protein